MTLLPLCEPLFLKMAELNRMAKLGQSQDYPMVRSDIHALFQKMAQQAAAEPKLSAQYARLELPLIFFVDSLLATSKLKFAAQWHQNRLAAARGELAGDDRFFDLLEETLNDTSDDASERLAVFYTCLGLGFVGSCAGQPEQLEKYMHAITPRISHLLDKELENKLCREAYKLVDRTNLIERPSQVAVLGLVLFAFLTLAILVVYWFMYHNASEGLRSTIQQIQPPVEAKAIP